MLVRKALLPNDFEAMLSLNGILSPDEDRAYFRNNVDKFKGSFLVAEEREKIVGFASLSYPFWNQIGLILHLAVTEGERSKGMGSALINAVIDESKQAKLRFLTVRTASWNTRALIFYERCGFTRKAVFDDYFGDKNAMVWLQLDLR